MGFSTAGRAGLSADEPARKTGAMTRRMTDVYSPATREDAVVSIPVPFVLAGSWHAEVRGRLVDDQGEWFFEVGYNTGVAENRIGTFPAAWVRRPELTDLDGIVPVDVLAEMRRQAGVESV